MNQRYSLGLLIVIVGVVLLLGKLGLFQWIWGVFWPLLPLGAGLLLGYMFLQRKFPSTVLVPAGMLVIYSLMFIYCNLLGFSHMSYLWPGFIFGPAVGLYAYYIYDQSSPRGAFVAALILAVVSVSLFAIIVFFKISLYIIAIALIGAGVYMLLGRRRSSRW